MEFKMAYQTNLKQMKDYRRLNLITGWFTFLISAIVYTLTIEPSASFWDCGEFISASFKLLVGHPPGAPFFMIVGRFFSLFAINPQQVSVMLNLMSAFASAFTILFLFWSITHLARKIFIAPDQENETWRTWAVMGAGLVGALAYTFSDTFWFSAVEGEVYAMSSLFTALVFWAILKWENVAGEPHSNRWLILIAYLMGLSIGVHLLNLLAIPAIVMVYYFKNYEVTRKNTIKAFLISCVILGGILYGIIPGVVSMAGAFELFFVNSLGFAYNTGALFYAFLLIAAIIAGIWYTIKKQHPILNTIITGIAVILIGYSSYAMIVIRSVANPSMDQNSPEDVFSLMGYLNREQYGDRPLFFGQNFNSPLDRAAMEGKKGSPIYIKKDGKYVVAEYRTEYKFDEQTTTPFPRMYSRDANHIAEYKRWTNMTGRSVRVTDESGQMKNITVPTMFDNIAFFWNYQVIHMYFRYFMWNFSGRQNDIQGQGEVNKGNWITGIPFIDNAFYGDQSLLPASQKENKARNTLFMLPLILGIAGMFFQYRRGAQGKQGFWIVMLLFFLTGLAIVLYLNQTPLQPRERDYAYAGSFYAFTIWIGLGVLGLVETLRKYTAPKIATITAIVATLLLVPCNMASENWDDHDRSHRYIARDLAYNYLNSCDENAILFTNGDNDTFPLWYAQEVEGVRTDVRVCNLSYLQTDWYIDQMKRKAYKSDPLPISFTHDQYVTGNRDAVYLFDRIEGDVDLKEALRFVASDDPRTKQIPEYSGKIDYMPSKSFKLDIDRDKIIQKGVVSQAFNHKIDSLMTIRLNKNVLLKNELMVLDMLATTNWDRPMYYAVTVGSDNYAGLQNYFQLEGFAYRIVPIKSNNEDGQTGRVDTERMYKRLMEDFRWGGYNDPRVYLDENILRMALNIRNNLTRLANSLLDEGKKEKAIAVLDKTMKELPAPQVPHNYFSIFIAQGYYKAGIPQKGDEIMNELAAENLQELVYFTSLKASMRQTISNDMERNIAIYYEINRIANQYQRGDLMKNLSAQYTNVLNKTGFFNQ